MYWTSNSCKAISADPAADLTMKCLGFLSFSFGAWTLRSKTNAAAG